VNALIVTHHPEEGPGLLENILQERGWKLDEVGLWNGTSLPDPTPFHLLILMGESMSIITVTLLFAVFVLPFFKKSGNSPV
jgi:hypothetical protein